MGLRRITIAWICLALVGGATLAFGVITTVVPIGPNEPLMRANGLASTGMGLFGLLITATAFRRRERWAWWALWFYPVFWTAHLVGRLPPGNDHIHQVVLIALSITGLLLPLGHLGRHPDGRGDT
ncbi:hypothetical protein EUA03_22950 [Mycolicibacterium mucogenicum]|uniref:SPW repeat-containing protein n=1 Tax=Mycolicibacterium mucogenicum TaxID=56689 RepID=A0A4R5W8N9_MYCMU|nr:hypothetical protein EUA03_22950 [Mycolicibacterium mucogenicum]